LTIASGERLKGRKIVVTGAASGMGEAVARLFAAEGAALTLLDITEARLSAIADELGQHAVAGDISDENGVERAISGAAERMGGIDGLVNVAGILVRKPVRETSFADFQRVLSVNLGGPFLTCRAALPLLEQAEFGTIINVASLAGLRSQPGLAAYSATKAGLVAFTEALSGELGPTVRINAVCPGVIETPMTAYMFEDDSPHVAVETLNRAARPGTPEEVAKVCLFLSTPESAFVSSAAIAVTGGHFR